MAGAPTISSTTPALSDWSVWLRRRTSRLGGDTRRPTGDTYPVSMRSSGRTIRGSGGSLLSAKDRAILADDTSEQRRKDERIIEVWSRGVDLKAEADEARARLLNIR